MTSGSSEWNAAPTHRRSASTLPRQLNTCGRESPTIQNQWPATHTEGDRSGRQSGRVCCLRTLWVMACATERFEQEQKFKGIRRCFLHQFKTPPWDLVKVVALSINY